MDTESILRFTILASAVEHSWRAMEKALERR
jgi:hypothetical protein